MNDLLTTFSNDLNVAVIGASGGIGRGFVDHLSAHDNVEHVYAFSRSDVGFDDEKVTSGYIDILNEDSIAAAVALVEDKLDIVIVATGVLHDKNTQPEKSLRDLSMQQFHAVFEVNTFGPALVAKYFTTLLPRNRRSVFAALSARVGSISDNGLGGWYAYRASKAALNMVIKNTAIEVARQNKEAAIIGLHPGTVDTGLSEPFQSKVASGKLFTPEHSAGCLLRVINDVRPQQSGRVFAWDGTEILA